VLIDVSGDGVPLLLLVVEDNNEWSRSLLVWNMLFGYSDGAIQRITEQPLGVGITVEEDETLLVLMHETDFYSTYDWYRVNNGAAEFIKTDTYVSNWHDGDGGAFFINDIEVNVDDFIAVSTELENRIKYLLRRGHTGYMVVEPAFMEYLQQLLTREQAVQIFRNHVESLS
jgi:hypothetical protein